MKKILFLFLFPVAAFAVGVIETTTFQKSLTGTAIAINSGLNRYGTNIILQSPSTNTAKIFIGETGSELLELAVGGSLTLTALEDGKVVKPIDLGALFAKSSAATGTITVMILK